MTTEEKLIHFQESAMETARSQTAADLDAYTDTLNTLYEEHCEQARRQSQIHLQTAKEALYRERNKRMSQTQMDIRRRLVLATAEIEEQLFAEVKTLLEDYKKTPDYMTLLRKQIQEAKQIAGQDTVRIYLDSSDENKKAALEQETGLEISISPYVLLGGVRAMVPARSILIDQSFASRLEEEREHIQLGGDTDV